MSPRQRNGRLGHAESRGDSSLTGGTWPAPQAPETEKAEGATTNRWHTLSCHAAQVRPGHMS